MPHNKYHNQVWSRDQIMKGFDNLKSPVEKKNTYLFCPDVKGYDKLWNLPAKPTRENVTSAIQGSHFQGICVDGARSFYAVSGSAVSRGDLFVMDAQTGEAFANLKPTELPVKGKHAFGGKHAGGIQVIGDFIAVPVEKDNQSRTIIYQKIGKKVVPRLYLDRDHKAGAVGMTQLRSGRYVIAIAGNDSKPLYFYITGKNVLENPGPNTRWEDLNQAIPLAVFPTTSDGNNQTSKSYGPYQNINLFTDSSKPNDRIYMIGLFRDKNIFGMKNTPLGGADKAHMFEVFLNYQEGEDRIRKVDLGGCEEVHIVLKNGANLGAGGGITLIDGKMMLTGVAFWKEKTPPIIPVQFQYSIPW